MPGAANLHKTHSKRMDCIVLEEEAYSLALPHCLMHHLRTEQGILESARMRAPRRHAISEQVRLAALRRGLRSRRKHLFLLTGPDAVDTLPSLRPRYSPMLDLAKSAVGVMAFM